MRPGMARVVRIFAGGAVCVALAGGAPAAASGSADRAGHELASTLGAKSASEAFAGDWTRRTTDRKRGKRRAVRRATLVDAPLVLPAPADGVVGRASTVAIPAKAFRVKAQLVFILGDGTLVDAGGSYELTPDGKIVPTSDESKKVADVAYSIVVAKADEGAKVRNVAIEAALRTGSQDAAGRTIPLTVHLVYWVRARAKR